MIDAVRSRTMPQPRSKPIRRRPFAVTLDGGLVAAGSQRAADDGTATAMFEKDVIRPGRFVHPKKGWTLDVTPARLQSWAETARKMIAAGHSIEVKEDHRNGAGAIRGYVKDAFVRGDGDDARLIFTQEMRGDGVKLAETVKNVSVEIEPEFVDGQGTRWPDAITAIAICEKPIVPGQDYFRRIAASDDGGDDDTDEIPRLLSEAALPEEDDPGDDAMTIKEVLKLATKLAGKDVTEQNVETVLTETFQAAAKQDETAKEKQKLEASLKEAQAGGGDPKDLDPTIKALSSDALDTRLKSLVETGRITAACAKALKPHLSTTLMLSVASGADKPGFQGILAALEENPERKHGERTKLQTLSRDEDDETRTPEQIEAERKKNLDMAYGRAPQTAA